MLLLVSIDDTTILVALQDGCQIRLLVEEIGAPSHARLRLTLFMAMDDVIAGIVMRVAPPDDGVKIFQCWVREDGCAEMVGQ